MKGKFKTTPKRYISIIAIIIIMGLIEQMEVVVGYVFPSLYSRNFALLNQGI